MLDVDARIVDASGKVVAHDNKPKARYAEFDTPQNGFTNYPSTGCYAIDGEITTDVTGITAPSGAESIRVYRAAGGLWKSDVPENRRIGEIAVSSLAGAVVFRSAGRAPMDLSGRAGGTYVLRMKVDGSAVVKHIVHP